MSTEFVPKESFWRPIRELKDALVDFLLPPTCAYCRRVGDLFCSDCRSRVLWLREPICQQCGRPQDVISSLCSSCTYRSLNLEQIRAATLHEDPVRRVLHLMKYEGYFALAHPLAELMIQAWPKWRIPVDLVIPIPLHSERKRQRGYNQAELLVEMMNRPMEWEYNSRALLRHRRTVPQVGLDIEQRRKNVQGAFLAEETLVANKRILLVDDVCTTGSTLDAAASVLLEAGAKSVAAYCLTRVSGTYDASRF